MLQPEAPWSCSYYALQLVCQEATCLNHLLPHKRDPHVISKMCHPTWYPIPYNRTKLYQSFIHYALSHYQTQ